MSLTSSRRPQTHVSSGEVRNPELAILITSLAESASDTIPPLYSLHAAIAGAYGPSSHQVRLFAKTKENIRQEWEIWLSFLRRSLAYARNYITLCNSLQTDGHAVAASMVVSDAGLLVKEANGCRRSYAHALRQFASLSQMYDPPPRSALPQPHRRKAIHNLPIILRTFSISLTALQSSSRCFDNITTFWGDHFSYVSKLAASQINVEELVRSGQLKEQIELWSTIHNSLRQATSNITAYCDAMTVVPMGISRQGRGSFRARIDSLDLSVQQDPKIQEAGYYEVLTAQNPYDISGLTAATSRVRRRFQAIIGLTRQDDMDPLLEVRYQAERYATSISNAYKMATKARDFYSQARQLCQGGRIPASLRATALEVRVLLQTLLNEYDGIYAQLLNNGVNNTDTGREAKVSKLVLSLLDDLRVLIYKLEDLDHFWFGLVAGVEYLSGRDDLSGLRVLKNVWQKQEAGFDKYANEIFRANALRQASSLSPINNRSMPTQSLAEADELGVAGSLFCCGLGFR